MVRLVLNEVGHMFDIGRRHHLPVVVCVWLLSVCTPAAAQSPRAPAPADTPPPATDPLGRDSPFGTITGFSSAVHRNDLAVAARYMQRERRGPQQLEDLARDLSDLLDRYFTERLSALSMEPTGNLADGLDPDREGIHLEIGDRPVDLFLKRVKDPSAGLIWLIASESLTRVPALHRDEAATWVERVMPASLVSRSYYGLSLAQWILWAFTLLAPLLLFGTFAGLVLWLAKRRSGTGGSLFLSSWSRVRWPFVLTLTLISHLVTIPLIGFSVRFRVAYTRFILIASVIIVAVLVWRLVTATFQRARLSAIRRGRSNTRSLVQLGERVIKVLVALVALLVLLALSGVDPATALAGVGIAGVAVALGAQKSVENLLGAVFLLTDRVLAVGDFCCLSDRVGWIEDITLRSVRLRTLDQTLLSVPAGLLSQGSIENYTTRGKILLQTVLRLRYGTSSEQLHVVLEDVRQLLAQHPSIEKDGARARLTSFGAQAIEIELFAYVMTADYAAFLEIRESLLLHIAHIVESSGSAFAVPTQFIYMRSEVDENRPLLAHQP
jgi:MscS family membrane protein